MSRALRIAEHMIKSVLLTVTLVSAPLFSFNSSVDRASQEDPMSIWAADLTHDSDYAAHLSSSLAGRIRRPSVHFLNSRTLVLTFDDASPWLVLKTAQSTRKPYSTDELETLVGFHAMFVKADNGSIVRKVKWRTGNDKSQLLPIGDGEFIALVGQKLTYYDADVQPVRELSIATAARSIQSVISNPQADFWQAEVAPGGHTFVLAHTVDKSTTYEWRDAKKFSQLGVAKAHGYGPFSCSDTEIVRPFPPLITIAEPGVEFRPLCRECRGYGAVFLDDRNLLIVDQHEFRVVSTLGQVLAKQKLENTVQLVSSSFSSRRVALGSTTSDRHGEVFTVRVFDWRSNSMIRVFRYRKDHTSSTSPDAGFKPYTGFNQWALALSPDGSRLALLRDGVLEMYRLG